MLGRRGEELCSLGVCFPPGALTRWLSSMLFGWEVEGAHAPVGPVQHPPAHSLGVAELCYSKGWSCPRPCSGKTRPLTPRICWIERPHPCQHRHLTFLFNLYVRVKKTAKLPLSEDLDCPGVGVGTRARAPHVPQHLPEGHSSLIPVCLGARLSREPAPFLYTQPQGYPSPPLCPAPPFVSM